MKYSALAPVLAALFPFAAAAAAQQPDKNKLIQQALAAAPEHIAREATVALPKPDGTMETLRPGSNGFTCLPDNPETPGLDPMCLDQEAMVWAGSWMSHAERPANTAPGIAYMLAGGSDASATDPWAQKPAPGEKFIDSPPHWMILWPFDSKATGLPTTPKKTGTWIMFAGTPYAHLMVNQKP